jgi:hypothetical protein
MNMRAKMEVREVTKPYDGAEQIKLSAVCGKPYNAGGESEDNSYARWTPSGELSLTITNPNLIGQFKQGQKFYLDFTEATE